MRWPRHPYPPHVERREGRPLVDVGAHAERALAGARQHDGAHVRIRFEMRGGGFELIEHGRRQRIQLVGAIERDDSNRVLFLDLDQLRLSHDAPPSIRGRTARR
jgi:hypothetical protein